MKSSFFVPFLILTACGPLPPGADAGVDAGVADAGPAPVKCSSNSRWPANEPGEAMNPGCACRSCHLGENFMNQNGIGTANPQYAMFFMGTAYGDLHEENLCAANGVPPGTMVEILDADGALRLSLPVDSSGNFRSDTVAANMPLPYRARVRANGLVRTMSMKQMSGDCNTCHTEQGREGAMGRVVWPR